MKKVFSLLLVLVTLYILTIFYLNDKFPVRKIDYKNTNVENLNFPKDFLWGTATAAYQVEGNARNSNWTLWENAKDQNGKPRIKNNQKSGIGPDHWNKYPEDIKLLNELGVNAYRMNFSWSKICPKEGVYDEEVLKHYDKVIDELLKNNIQIHITLFWWEEPLWFYKKGAFEKEKNIKYFLDFVKKIYGRYGDRVIYWSTINEPNVYSSFGYVEGAFPPGKKDMKLSAAVTLNLLKSHVLAYNLIKSMPHGNTSKVGIVLSVTFFEPMNKYNLIDWIVASFYNNNMYGNILQFFKSGRYKYIAPLVVNLKYEDKNAPNTLDYIGVNYYSHLSAGINFSNFKNYPILYSNVEGEVPSVGGFGSVYPEGLYTAIKIVSDLKKPIIITENGIYDSTGKLVKDFIKKSMYSLSEAIKDGYDVKGYHYWALMDNFEWAQGYDVRMGLYHVDYTTKKRTLKDGAKEYQRIVKKFNK
ncbi:MAG: glycoside hydrolase family 1 protein [Solirubrobacteraceae bacterium]